MEYIYPTFKNGKILTREMLIALRDMAWLREQAAYQDKNIIKIFRQALSLNGKLSEGVF